MPASPLAFTHDVTERFLRYVVIDTQSDPASPTCPSTEKQKNLGRLLASELLAMGLADAHLALTRQGRRIEYKYTSKRGLARDGYDDYDRRRRVRGRIRQPPPPYPSSHARA